MAHSETVWTAAKTAYVEGYPQQDGSRAFRSLEEVGIAHSIPPDTMRKRAGREGWKDHRDLYRQKMAQARQEKRIDVLAAKGAEFDARALRVAEAVITQLAFRLNESVKAKAALQTNELMRMSTTLSNAHKSGRLAMGDTTEIERLATPVSPEFDLTALSDDELAVFERLRMKMIGIDSVAPVGVRH